MVQWLKAPPTARAAQVQTHQKIALALSFLLIYGLGGLPPRGAVIFGVPRRYFGAKMLEALASKFFFRFQF